MTDWYEHFQRNHNNRLPIPWGRSISIPEAMRPALIASLQRFQVGESGEGKHLKQGADATGDTRYAETIRLFIAEENEHSRWLAHAIKGLGGTLLTHHWSDILFIGLRRLMGLKTELMVLLIAEMIAMRYYRALKEGINDPTLVAVFANICQDEDYHVAFHVDYLRGAFSNRGRLSRWLIRTIWYFLYRAACLLVMWDHRGILKATNVPAQEFWRDTRDIFNHTADAIFTASPSSHAISIL